MKTKLPDLKLEIENAKSAFSDGTWSDRNGATLLRVAEELFLRASAPEKHVITAKKVITRLNKLSRRVLGEMDETVGLLQWVSNCTAVSSEFVEVQARLDDTVVELRKLVLATSAALRVRL